MRLTKIRLSKPSFLLGMGVGFFLGSKAGPGPYRKLESGVREPSRAPYAVMEPEAVSGDAADPAAAGTGTGTPAANGGHLPGWEQQLIPEVLRN